MEKWETVIRPKTRLFDLHLLEILQYRSMIYMLVKRNYQIQYKQTILGPAWILIGTILSSGLFSLLFGYVGQFQSDGIPYFLFYMTASILWSFFSGCVGSNSSIFMENAYLFGKIYFPRMVVPLANMLFQLIRFLIQFILCIIVWLFFYYKGETEFTGWYLLLLPFLILESGLLGTTLGMIVSSMTTKYRDLSHMMGFGLQLLMYAAPVLYPITQLPEVLQKIVFLNPMASVIEAFRFCITGSGSLHLSALIYSVIVTGICVLGSMILFNQTEKTFIDIV